MKFFKTIWLVCLQNLRKWRTDYRIWAISILAVIMIWIYIDDMKRIANGLGTEMPIWIFPFLFSQFHTKLIFTLPIILLFCNAPFFDSNQVFVCIRIGQIKWLCGQIMYVITASAIYYLFLMAVTLISTLPTGCLSMDWGKTLITIANSNAAMYFDSPFVTVSKIVIVYFSPLSAMWFTFLLSWLCAIMLGLIIFFCNIVSKTRGLGITITSLLVVLSTFVDNGFPNALAFSPISWNTVDKIDVGGYTTNPPFVYCISVYCTLIVTFTVGIIAFGMRKNMDLKGE